jgi:hypothetical protein
VVLYDTEKELDAFEAGFVHATPGDDTSWVTEMIELPTGVIHAMIILWGDSDASDLRVSDHRHPANAG